MGVVYEAVDRSNSRRLALKTLSLKDASSIYRFKEEFRGLADVVHPNLVALHELAVSDKQWFFTMELVNGTELLKYLRSENPILSTASTEVLVGGVEDSGRSQYREDASLGPEAASPPANFGLVRNVMAQLAEGVHALHCAGKLHRDIKPGNVMVSVEGRVVLLDFGLATDYFHRDLLANQIVVGTVSYMSPEQACQKEYGPASDWYSVGVVLYQVLTGKLPFVGRPQEVLKAKQEKDPSDPRSLLPNLPAKLCDLCMRLLARDPEKRPTGEEILELLGTKNNRTATLNIVQANEGFVGRKLHLARLYSEFIEIKEKRGPRCICVHGAPGIGKSALMEKFGWQVTRDDGALVLAGRCYERESLPFKAVDTIVDSLSRYLSGLSQEAVRRLLPEYTQPLSRLFPVLRTVKAIGTFKRSSQPVDPLELRRRALIALRELICAIGQSVPLVIRVDDFQWGDTDSAVLLVSLLGPPAPPNLMLCISYRSDDRESSRALRVLHKRLASMGQHSRVSILELEALTIEEVERLAASRISSSDNVEAQEFALRVARESRGNPFFVEEMCRYLNLSDGDPALKLMGPLSLEETIMSRFAELSTQQRDLLEVVAIAGAPISETIALLASGLKQSDSPDVSVLRSGRLLRSNHEDLVARLESYHDRIRELLVSNISDERRKHVYRNLAQAYEVTTPTDSENIAGYFARAGLFEEARGHAISAAEDAVSALAFERAALYYRMALKAQLEPVVGQKTRVALASALSNAGMGTDAAQAYLSAAQGAVPAVALDYRRLAAENMLRAGHVDDAVETFKGVLSTVGLSFAGSSRRSLVNLLWWRMTLRVRGVKFKAREVSEISPGALLKVAVCGSCALGFGMNDPIRGAEFQTRHFLLALRSGETSRVGRAMALEGVYRALEGAGSRVAAEELIATAQDLGEKSSDPVVAAFASSAQALVHYQCGEWREALEYFDTSAGIYLNQCRGHQSVACQAERMAVDTLYALGDMAELAKRVPAILRAADDRGDLHGVTDMRTGLPNSHWLVRDQVSQAIADCERGEKQWSERSFFLQHYYSALAFVQIELYEGKGEAALERFEAMLPKLKGSMLLRVPVVRTQSAWLHGRALLAAAQESEEKGRRNKLLAQTQRISRKLEAQAITNGKPFAALLRAQCEVLRGNQETAVKGLKACVGSFEKIDMRMCQMICVRELGNVLGGTEGADLLEQGQTWMDSQGIENPDSFSRMLIPIQSVR